MSIEIVNRALAKLGQPFVSSLEQEPDGVLLSRLFVDERDLLLADYPWRFAMKTVVLAPDADIPVGEFAYSYTLPSDFLGLYRFGLGYKRPNYSDNIVMSDARYSIEGNKILCNRKDKLYLKYIARIEDVKQFSPWFREALIAKIAAELAPRKKQSPQLKQALEQEFAAYIERAEQNNALLEDEETIPDSSWVSVRAGWNDEY